MLYLGLLVLEVWFMSITVGDMAAGRQDGLEAGADGIHFDPRQ